MSEPTEWLRAVAAGIQRHGHVVAESSTPFLDAADHFEALAAERDHLIVSNGLSNKEILRLTKELAEAKAEVEAAARINGHAIDMAIEAHNAAIEEAAKVADSFDAGLTGYERQGSHDNALAIAAAIRALSRSNEPTNG